MRAHQSLFIFKNSFFKNDLDEFLEVVKSRIPKNVSSSDICRVLKKVKEDCLKQEIIIKKLYQSKFDDNSVKKAIADLEKKEKQEETKNESIVVKIASITYTLLKYAHR